jgi:membrane fusion protein, multidrug efflux system
MAFASLRLALHASAVAAVLVVLAGCGDPAPAPATTATAASKLTTQTVGEQATPAELMLDGVVEAVQQATLSAQTAGRVAEIRVDINDRVQPGQLLLRLRSSEQVAGLGQAQAALQAARAQDAQARAQHDRIRDMYERKVVARATYDEAVAARDAAAANLAATRAALESAQEGVAYTELRAPYAGVVTAKRVQSGEAVAPGTPLLTIAALDAMRVVAEVPQSAARAVQEARQAQVYVGDERIAVARITLYPSAEPQSGTFRARIDLPDGATQLAPGTFAKVGIVVGESNRILVPAHAVVERSELRAVYVVTPDGPVVLRQVRLGRRTGDDIEVIAGLARGEKVAVDPAAAGIVARAGASQRP